MSLTKPEIYELLHKHNVIIVHFSGCPKGSGVERNDHMYPNDLKFVLEGNAQGGLSCSTVKPCDCFHGIERNATGCIGVVLGLKDETSLKAVSPDDCGSSENLGVRESWLANEVTAESAAASILNRKSGTYNEWIVGNYQPLGIFAVNPFEVSALFPPPRIPEMPEELQGTDLVPGIKQTTLTEISGLFQDQLIFSFYYGKLCRWEEGTMQEISHDELYRTEVL